VALPAGLTPGSRYVFRSRLYWWTGAPFAAPDAPRPFSCWEVVDLQLAAEGWERGSAVHDEGVHEAWELRPLASEAGGPQEAI